MSLDSVRAVADAVLLEGYVLYPYRATAVKNRYRWAFGVLAPEAWSEQGGGDPSRMQVEALIEGRPGEVRIRGHLRFLQIEDRRIERCGPDGELAEVESLEVGGELHLPWEEGRIREVAFEAPAARDFEIPGGCEIQWLREGGEARGRVVRAWSPIQGELRAAAEPVGDRLTKVRVEIRNLSGWSSATRSEALRHSMVSTHLILSADGGSFLSLLDPPGFAQEAVKGCENQGLYPVLAGEPGQGDLLLASPIILYDHPAVAPESPGDFFDATEIDELLVLRTSTLTEEEKREARATDPQAARLLDRVEGLSPEGMDKLHGTIRARRDSRRGPPLPGPGARVRILESVRRTDAQDALFVGRIGRVEKVMQDVSGESFLALTLEDDPAAELNRGFGRFLYYRLDEVEPAS